MKRVAILVGDTALASLLTSLIEELPDVQVYEFQSVAALTTFLRISVVHLIMADEGFRGAAPESIARTLRCNPVILNRGFAFLVLTRHQHDMPGAGVDETLTKPMSPGNLQARIRHHLDLPASRYLGSKRRRSEPPAPPPRRRNGNIVYLFE